MIYRIRPKFEGRKLKRFYRLIYKGGLPANWRQKPMVTVFDTELQMLMSWCYAKNASDYSDPFYTIRR